MSAISDIEDELISQESLEPEVNAHAVSIGPVRTVSSRLGSKAPRKQGIFWIFTVPSGRPSIIPGILSTKELPEGVVWMQGQLERGAGGLEHYQFVAAFSKKMSLLGVRGIFGNFHAEATISGKANDYCIKPDTRIGEPFEFGAKPIQRNDKLDWEGIWISAQSGDLLAIPPSIRVVSYRTLRTIRSDYSRPEAFVRTATVYFGPTETGKSRRAWDEAGFDAYPKCPRTKFWDGYDDHANVVMDEFRCGIDLAHVLRWLDRYPSNLEIKGSTRPNRIKHFWITSNLHPREWYVEVDSASRAALFRRLKLIQILRDRNHIWTPSYSELNETITWNFEEFSFE